MIRIFIIIFTLLALNYTGLSQRFIERGDEALELQHYYEAISNYQSQLDKRNSSKYEIAEASFKIGYCYLKLSLPEKAEGFFKKSIDNNYNAPIVHYYYGQTLQMLQKYYEALLEFEKFKELEPDNELADKGVENINYSFAMLKEPTRYEVNIVARLSSPESDYSPFFEQRNYRRVYFTSTRFTEIHEQDNPESGDYCSNIFYAEQDRNNRWGNPVILPGFVNTIDEEGAACLNFRSNNLYFTRCSYDKRQDKGCRIYMAQKSGRFWGRVAKVEIPGIPEHVSIGHPAISNDELTLYFSAEGLPGSYGGKDIYKVTRERRIHNFGYPQNMGPKINTEGDEMYPYVRINGELYFSSNGHHGMGGLDIFKAVEKDDGSYEVINLGSPINSSHDDFGIVFMGNREEGFLSSRRSRGMGKTDIFHFVLPEIDLSLSGTVWDKKTGKRLSNVEIQIMNEEYILMGTELSNEQGNFNIKLEPEMNYIIQYISDSYKTEVIEINAKEILNNKKIRKDIFLNK